VSIATTVAAVVSATSATPGSAGYAARTRASKSALLAEKRASSATPAHTCTTSMPPAAMSAAMKAM